MDADPMVVFAAWYTEACASEQPMPHAMTLATADGRGRPSARMVLLHRADAGGFVFFTNYESRKAEELAAQPWAALVFWWQVLQRQVRVEGLVSRLADADADAYFASRSRGKQRNAWVSPQSRVIEDLANLEREAGQLDNRYPDRVPRPPFWGGYRLQPDRIEFWQEGPHRLHDRIRYQRTDRGWTRDRLAP